MRTRPLLAAGFVMLAAATVVVVTQDTEPEAPSVIDLRPQAVWLAGRVIVDPAVDPQLLEVRVRQGLRRRRALLDPKGRFELRELRPGICRVDVVITSELSLAHRDVRVPVRVGPFDPEQEPWRIDLRGALHPIALTVLTPEAETFVKGEVRIVRPRPIVVLTTDGQGRVEFLRRQVPFDLTIETTDPKEGTWIFELRGVDGSRTVTIDPDRHEPPP